MKYFSIIYVTLNKIKRQRGSSCNPEFIEQTVRNLLLTASDPNIVWRHYNTSQLVAGSLLNQMLSILINNHLFIIYIAITPTVTLLTVVGVLIIIVKKISWCCILITSVTTFSCITYQYIASLSNPNNSNGRIYTSVYRHVYIIYKIRYRYR